MQQHQCGEILYYSFEGLNDLPGITHGVFTRHGGVSPAPYASLNVGSTVGDALDGVLENRRRMAAALGVSETDSRTTWQVHGADVLVIRDRSPQPWPPPRADAIVTAVPDVPLVMRFADCVPIILADPVRRVIGLAHAGWRGTLAGAASAAVAAMTTAFGSHPSDIVAGIGPSIGPCCYEVGPEVVEAFAAWDGIGQEVIVPPGGAGKGAHLDLWLANRRDLGRAGVTHIEAANLCTACHNDDFYSHRREHGRTGRFGVIITLRGSPQPAGAA